MARTAYAGIVICLWSVFGGVAPGYGFDLSSVSDVRTRLAEMPKPWVSIRRAGELDLVGFHALMAFRCTFGAVRYGVNGAPPEQPIVLEPCHAEYSVPSVMLEEAVVLALPADAVERIEIEIEYLDGTRQRRMFRPQAHARQVP